MRKLLIIPFAFFLILNSCSKTLPPPCLEYVGTNADSLTLEQMLHDTNKVLVAGMPIHLDSTDVLIHPIGWVDMYVKKYNSLVSGSVNIDYPEVGKSKMKDSNYSFSVHSNYRDYISGQMVNLIFEDMKTGEKRKLTDKAINIYTVSYLRNVWRNIGKQYLLYSVVDKDYNRDGKLDAQDMTAYYMSNLDGTNFTKITEDYHFFDTDQLILKNNKYYFRTLEDVNKDGIFNKKDKYHYYYIDLTQESFSPIEYFPLEIFDINK